MITLAVFLTIVFLNSVDDNETMIGDNLRRLKKDIARIAHSCGRDPDDIKVVAVSKRFSAEVIREAHAAGQILFGENFLQEAVEKKKRVADTVAFHFIGHLQSNKAKIAAQLFDMIETVDRIKIARALNRHLEQNNRTLDILVQVNIGYDDDKSGVLPENTEQLFREMRRCTHLRPHGLMTMPPLTTDSIKTRAYFSELRSLAESLQAKEFLPSERFELSMGMSADYPIAIEEGATLIRVGTAIFGQRPPR